MHVSMLFSQISSQVTTTIFSVLFLRFHSSITDFEKKGRGRVEDQTNLLQIHAAAASFFFFFGLHCTACRILVLQPGSECTVKSAES